MNQKNKAKIIEKTNQRFENQYEYFSEEYNSIHKRRKPKQEPKPSKPENLTGIGFSGGGIKSSAFHLGLLSGLHKAGLLHEIDYISSVSGGSWANGAYWAIHESDSSLFDSLDTITNAKYADGNSGNQNKVDQERINREIYKNKKYELLLPNRQDRIFGGRAWQRHIRSHYLFNDDINFSKFLKYDKQHLYSKPFPIFLATHTNKILGLKDKENFPFEITPLGMGTVVDCKTLIKCVSKINGKTVIKYKKCGFCRRWLRPHLWKHPPKKGFYIPFGLDSEIDISVKKYIDNSDEGLYLSHAMWSSGGLIAKLLSLHLRISKCSKKVPEAKQKEKVPGVKGKYVLSDGGKADNTGLTPLVERGVDLIILSQIAGDPNVKEGDIDKAEKQVKRLFGVEVGFKKQKSPKVIRDFSYPAKDEKTIIFIKPTVENITGFFQSKYKDNPNLEDLRKEYENKKKKKYQFPQHKTFKTKYKQKTINAYYLLGRFIGEQDLANHIREWKNGE